MILISASSLFIHILSKTSSFCWSLVFRNIRQRIHQFCMPRLIMIQLGCSIVVLSFSVVIAPKVSMSKPTSRKVIYSLTSVYFLTNFALSRVKSVLGACEILFKKGKISSSIFDMINCIDHRFAIMVSKVSTYIMHFFCRNGTSWL